MSDLLAALPKHFDTTVENVQTAGKAFEPTAARCTCSTVPCCCCWSN
ncbi:plantazolicin family TOMM peptide [Rothia sp. HMSC065G12]